MNKVDKPALRRHFRAARNALTESHQAQAGQRLLAQLSKIQAFSAARTIAAYLANDGELDLTPTIHACWQQGINTTLPLLDPRRSGHLLFHDYAVNTPMSINRYGIAEPTFNAAHCRPLAQLDVLLLPLVAFDHQGNRLGMGGGFYDRTLADLERNNRPTLIGIAHDCQQAETLPVEPWDIPLDYIVTPSVQLTVAP